MTTHPTDALVTALAAGKSIPDAAAQAGISERTAYRRVKDPLVQQQMRALRSATRDRVVGQLADATTAAVAALVRNLEAPSPQVQVRAATAILELDVRWRTTDELERRVAELEAALAAKEDWYGEAA